jgi:hypothetical protein
MKVGTRSLLFGVHQFIWHPITVYRAWRDLYGKRPTWKETICIIVHDWGYWGCVSMDGPGGELHSLAGSGIAWMLFDLEHEELVLYHSRHYAAAVGVQPSKLCWPDKLSMLYDPVWFYLLRARLSGEIREYHWNAIQKGFVPARSTQREWLVKLREHLGVKARKEAVKFA